MLPGLNLPGSLLEILSALRPCFTGPSFVTFCGLAAGLAGQARRRTVTGMLLGACCTACGRMTGHTTSSPGHAGRSTSSAWASRGSRCCSWSRPAPA